MRHGAYIVAIAAALAAGVLPAFGQQDRKVGLVMGYPASAAVLWHMTDGVALRPDISFTRQSIENTFTTTDFTGGTSTQTTTSAGWTTSVGLSALFYLGPPDALRVYVTPRLAYVWTRTSYDGTGALTLTPYETESDGFLAAGSLGAQYSLHERFRVFGELGLSYTSQEGTLGLSVTRNETKTSSVGLRSGVGVVVYF